MVSMQNIQRGTRANTAMTPEFASILIVDDERFDRARLRRFCQALEFDVNIAEADSLAATGTALELDTYDLVFLDYALADGSGLQALDAIRMDARNRHAATIMVTGHVDAEIGIEAMKKGCSDFLKKDDISYEAIRKAAVDALQKARRGPSVGPHTLTGSRIEAVLDTFAKDCVSDLKPLVFKMMRQVRHLNATREDEEAFQDAVRDISTSCNRLVDFMNDIDDHERKAVSLMDVEAVKRSVPRTRSEKKRADRARLFGRRPTRPH